MKTKDTYDYGPLKQTAWCLGISNLQEPYHANDNVYYGTKGQAKIAALSDNDGMQTLDEEDLSFLNIRVVRWSSYDKFEFRGEVKTKNQIDRILEEEQRNANLDILLKENPNGFAYIWAGCHGAFHGWNNAGYYTDRYKGAGIYPLEYAVDYVKRSSLGRYEEVRLIDMEVHNAKVQERIDDLNKYLLGNSKD